MLDENVRLCVVGIRYVDADPYYPHRYKEDYKFYCDYSDLDFLWEFEEAAHIRGTVGSFLLRHLPVGSIITRWSIHLTTPYGCQYFAEFQPSRVLVYKSDGSRSAETVSNINGFLDFHVAEAFRFPLLHCPGYSQMLLSDSQKRPKTLWEYVCDEHVSTNVPVEKYPDLALSPGAWVMLVLREIGVDVAEVASVSGLEKNYLEDLFSEKYTPDLSEYNDVEIATDSNVARRDIIGAFPMKIQKVLNRICSRFSLDWLDCFVREYRNLKKKGVPVVTYDDVAGDNYEWLPKKYRTKWLL